MARTVTILKFVGVVNLGILTGLSTTLATTTLPTLLSLPSASSALPAFLTLQSRAKRHLRLLTGTAVSTLCIAYLIAPSSGRHPYLLWTSLIASCGGGVDYFLRHDEDALREEAFVSGGVGSGGSGQSSPTPAEKSWVDLEKGEDVNGEVVRGAMEKFAWAERVRTGVSGAAFVMALVGIWGDGA